MERGNDYRHFFQCTYGHERAKKSELEGVKATVLEAAVA